MRYAIMLVFLDFEASSLSKRSYPIEVGWVFEDGKAEAYLIRPAPDWTDWDEEAEAIHHIAPERLWAEGAPHDVVAAQRSPGVGDNACRCLVSDTSDHACSNSWRFTLRITCV